MMNPWCVVCVNSYASLLMRVEACVNAFPCLCQCHSRYFYFCLFDLCWGWGKGGYQTFLSVVMF